MALTLLRSGSGSLMSCTSEISCNVPFCCLQKCDLEWVQPLAWPFLCNEGGVLCVLRELYSLN